MQIEFQEVSLGYWQRYVVPHYEQAHWEEVGQDKRWMPELDWDLYRRLECADCLLILCVFIDGKARGYFVGLVGNPTHYKKKKIMRTDLFYIEPGFRQFGVRLFKEAKEHARKMGCQKLYLTWKTSKDIEPIAKRCGFTTIEKTAVADLG